MIIWDVIAIAFVFGLGVAVGHEIGVARGVKAGAAYAFNPANRNRMKKALRLVKKEKDGK